MNIISCDVGWKRDTKRNAVAIATDSRQISFIKSGLDDNHLVALVCEWVRPQSLILLDVPIEGCDKLEGPRRSIENALQHYIALYPASMAGTGKRGEQRGKQLRKILLNAMPTQARESVIIEEIYPYAVYKFLWVAKQEGKLAKVRFGKWQGILDKNFTPSKSPPKYKGRKKGFNKPTRLAGIQELYTFLTRHLDLGLSQSVESPDNSYTISGLELLADQYDACLGAIVGLYCVSGNPYAWIAGNERQGKMLLLADIWLKERLEEYGITMRHLY